MFKLSFLLFFLLLLAPFILFCWFVIALIRYLNRKSKNN